MIKIKVLVHFNYQVNIVELQVELKQEPDHSKFIIIYTIQNKNNISKIL